MTTDRDLLLAFLDWCYRDVAENPPHRVDVDAFLASRSPAAAVSADGETAGFHELHAAAQYLLDVDRANGRMDDMEASYVRLHRALAACKSPVAPHVKVTEVVGEFQSYRREECEDSILPRGARERRASYEAVNFSQMVPQEALPHGDGRWRVTVEFTPSK
jgi:hypothetical protein